MTSQNYSNAKRQSQESKQPCPGYLGLSQRGGASAELADGSLPQHRSGKCKGAGSVPSPLQKGKLPEESSCQRNGRKRGQRSNKNQMTPLPHGLHTWKKCHNWASKFVTGHSMEAIFNCQVRNNLPWGVFSFASAPTPQRSSVLF